jgi:diadenylate cyclase
MELFKIGFITVRLLDLIDISVVTFIFYRLYHLLRNSIALRIMFALTLVFVFWKLVDLLDMVLLKSILDQIIGVGAIALIVVFAAEIRRFLVVLGRNSFISRAWEQFFTKAETEHSFEELVAGIEQIAKAGLGALIVITGQDGLERFKETGDQIGAEVSERLLYSIFLKDGPLHDGAVIIDHNKIAAARCILPLSANPDLPAELGLRHRSGLGLSEGTDALVIVISEERREVSIVKEGKLRRNVDVITLEGALREHFNPNANQTS